jgi:hypothetical protein
MSKALMAFFKSPGNWPIAATIWALTVFLVMVFGYLILENSSLRKDLAKANRQRTRALELILDQREQLRDCQSSSGAITAANRP